MFLSCRVWQLSIVVAAALMLAACSADPERQMTDGSGLRTEVRGHAKEARAQFMSGNFGLAERSYRKAVEENPDDAQSWLGLAASYDELRRFDLADRAYDHVRKLIGETPTVLNNIGYSHLLRGKLGQAERYINLAYEQEPENPVIQRNMQLLSKRLARRG